MVSDRFYDDLFLSAIYDAWHPRMARDDFDFYIPIIMKAGSVLDIGCGTGLLLHEVRESGHVGDLSGIDPGAGVLSRARSFDTIDWVLGTLPQDGWENKFDLAVMTGHAFQAIVTDDAVDEFLSNVRNCLSDNGLFAFESRNPLVRPWEAWTPEHSAIVQMADGSLVNIVTTLTSDFDGRTVSFRHDFFGDHSSLPMSSESTLRFHQAEELAAHLARHGFVVEQQYGDFRSQPLSETSPEIIIVARRH
ncbi:MAG: class I SAM-dependent methyltransferase [Mesorhizobium sp.]|nr:MAG: class I SAM-dependent methyltransferase [Mesorhizobium sp.]